MVQVNKEGDDDFSFSFDDPDVKEKDPTPAARFNLRQLLKSVQSGRNRRRGLTDDGELTTATRKRRSRSRRRSLLLNTEAE